METSYCEHASDFPEGRLSAEVIATINGYVKHAYQTMWVPDGEFEIPEYDFDHSEYDIAQVIEMHERFWISCGSPAFQHPGDGDDFLLAALSARMTEQADDGQIHSSSVFMFAVDYLLMHAIGTQTTPFSMHPRFESAVAKVTQIALRPRQLMEFVNDAHAAALRCDCY